MGDGEADELRRRNRALGERLVHWSSELERLQEQLDRSHAEHANSLQDLDRVRQQRDQLHEECRLLREERERWLGQAGRPSFWARLLGRKG